MQYTLHVGDSLQKLKDLPDNSVDSVVTDPPYEIGFMGKKWDNTGIANNVELWKEVLRVLKPGGHVLAFSATRTYHRMTCAIEDAGFEIRDQLQWLYGSGFPKSHSVSKGIDKMKGAKRTAEAKQWTGWGTALKPAHEPIVLARKPSSESTIAKNVIKHGTGVINIDSCRVKTEDKFGGGKKGSSGFAQGYKSEGWEPGSDKGRWPANILHDGSDEVLALFPSTKDATSITPSHSQGMFGFGGIDRELKYHGDGNVASRFFYSAKTSGKDRNEGCEAMPNIFVGGISGGEGEVMTLGRASLNGKPKQIQPKQNNHPTVKPTALMQYLVRLITPPNGTVLDPFMGSGSTGKACAYENFNFIGIDLSKEYVAIAKKRIEFAKAAYEAEHAVDKFYH